MNPVESKYESQFTRNSVDPEIAKIMQNSSDSIVREPISCITKRLQVSLEAKVGGENIELVISLV